MYKINIFAIFIISTILSGCSSIGGLFDDNKYYYKNGYQRVQLDIENESAKNSHPIKIDPLKIEGALKLILTKYGPRSEPLFQQVKLLPYSVSISEALIEAKPNQDVVFTIEGWYKKKTVSDNLVTSGRIFYNKNGLNIIFGSIMRKGNISETDPMLSHGINPDLVKNPYAPGSRYQTFKNKYFLSTIPNSGVFRPREAKGRSDWLVFSKKALVDRPNLTMDQKTFASGRNIQVQGLRDEVKQLRQELQNIQRNPYQTYNPPQGYYPPPQGYPTPPYGNYRYAPPPPQQYYYGNNQQQMAIPKSRNQISLKSLENMRERGLISEENYLRKLKELGY